MPFFTEGAKRGASLSRSHTDSGRGSGCALAVTAPLAVCGSNGSRRPRDLVSVRPDADFRSATSSLRRDRVSASSSVKWEYGR